MIEEWRPVKGYEGLYEVSNLGRVKSIPRLGTKGGYMNIPDGEYPRVPLSKDGQTYSKAIHRLVAESFIPNPDNKPEVDHIDTDPSNNRIDNLRWATRKENCNNPLSIEHYSECKSGVVFTEEHKRKLSESAKLSHSTDSYREKRSKQHYKHTEEAKRKISIAGKNAWSSLTDTEKEDRINKLRSYDGIQVKCSNDDKVFRSIKAAADFYGIKTIEPVLRSLRTGLQTRQGLRFEYV